MDLRDRAPVFCTFLGCSLSLALLVAALSTDRWVYATARRPTPESEGRINLGLFFGKKELNVAYGWRTDSINVLRLMRTEPDFMSYWWWLGTLAGVSVGVACSCVGGVSAVVRSASTSGGGRPKLWPLYASNALAALGQAAACACWLAQYFTVLRHGVLPAEDKKNAWTTEGQAELAGSFWFVVIGTLTSLLNIALLLCVSFRDRKEEISGFPGEEKINAAIMLY